MKTFEEAWKATGYHYGNDALEGVKLGWELCIAEMASMFNKENKSIKYTNSEVKRLADIKERYALAKKHEDEGNYRLADMIRPCCDNEKRNNNGGCDSCGDPCF